MRKKKTTQKSQNKKNSFVSSSRKNLAFGLFIIVTLGILIYSNTFRCSFHLDDNMHIVDNGAIKNISDVKTWWKYSPNRPVSMFTFVVNYHFGQLDVWGYHLVNLIIHLINACLVWWLTLLIFASPAMKANPVEQYKKAVSLFTALLFLSHPLATQSVTYIIQRQNALAALFYLLSIILYVKARLTSERKSLIYVFFILAFISATLAVLSKENAYTLPFAVLLFEFFFLRTKRPSIQLKDYRVILMIVAFVGFVIFILLRFSVNIFEPLTPYKTEGHGTTITSGNYLLTQFSVLVKYIQLLFLPIHQNLDYDFPISNNFFEIKTLGSFLFLLALIILATILFKRNRIISFGIFWFFLTLSIESSIIPIKDVIFEHRTYLPSLGFFVILSFIIYKFFGSKKFTAPILLIIGFYSMQTYQRNKTWKDDITLWSDVVEKSPAKARPYINRGLAYGNTGFPDKAISDFSKALQIAPNSVYALWNRGATYSKLRQWGIAIADYSKLIETDSEYIDAYFNRAAAYENLKQWDKAIADYSYVIILSPQHAKAYSNRGVVYFHLGETEKAISDYTSAIVIDPQFAMAYDNRGTALMHLGQYDDAINDFTKAVLIDTNFSKAYNNRGVAYGSKGQYDKAIADFNKALEIDPNFSDALKNKDFAEQKVRSNGK